MSDWRDDIRDAISAFLAGSDLAGHRIAQSDIEIEYLPAPHQQPKHLPPGKMAVFGFWGDGEWLTFSIAGPNSNARYVSQHYNARSARSTLSMKLIRDPHMRQVRGFNPNAAGTWIRNETHRVNILLPATQPREQLSLLKAFLLDRFEPRYGG